MNSTFESIVTRWSCEVSRPLFKGSLISDDGNGNVCRCAQGDVLHVAGWTDQQLREITQAKADLEVSKLLGISRAHSILLRNVNDAHDGCPQDVLTNPEKILGDKAQTVLSFWRYLDTLTNADWNRIGAAARAAAVAAAVAAAGAAAVAAAVAAARAAARDAAGDAAWDAARDAARAAAGAAAWAAARAAAGDAARAAARACNEIQGEALMIERGKKFYFLPLFGFADPQAVRDWEAGRQ